MADLIQCENWEDSWDVKYAAYVRGQLCPKMDSAGLALGLCGEAGEVAELALNLCAAAARTGELYKKEKYHGVPALRDKSLKEMGDTLFYLTALADEMGYTLQEVAAANEAKLRARYPNGFVNGGGIREAEQLQKLLDAEQLVIKAPHQTIPGNYKPGY